MELTTVGGTTMTSTEKAPLQGNYLLDQGSGTNLLGNNTVCDALSDTVKIIDTPVTIGILGKYGSGKTFLLSQIRNKLRKLNDEPKSTTQHENNTKPVCAFSMQCCFRFYVMVCMIALFALPVAMIVAPNAFVIPATSENGTVATNEPIFNPPDATTVSISGAVLLAVLIVLLFVGICLQNFLFSWWKNVHINCMVGFSKRPTEKIFKMRKKDFKSRYILVDFDAWEYVGCDRLWAGIITKLAQEIENEFGIITTRLFRAQYDEIEKCNDDEEAPQCCKESSHTCCFQICNYPKTKCCAPTLGCWIFALTCLISLFVAGIFSSLTVTASSTSAVVQATFITLPLLAAVVAAVKASWTIFYSQSQRIFDKLKGVKTNYAEDLGFMHSVKVEVDCMTDLIEWAEFSKRCRYKVVICIDNLDRIPLPRVKAVVEAVNILLSDPTSPFICLLAVDQRTAIYSVEECGETTRDRTINGYEYLKKIISLPVYYPEVSSDIALNYLNQLLSQAYGLPNSETKEGNDDNDDDNKQSDGDTGVLGYLKSNYMRFMTMYKHFNTGFLIGNLRNIKRIVNIEILSTNILHRSLTQRKRNEETSQFCDTDKQLLNAWSTLTFDYPGLTRRLWAFLEESRGSQILQKTLPTIFENHESQIITIEVNGAPAVIGNNDNQSYLNSLKKSLVARKTGEYMQKLLCKSQVLVDAWAKLAFAFPCRTLRLWEFLKNEKEKYDKNTRLPDIWRNNMDYISTTKINLEEVELDEESNKVVNKLFLKSLENSLFAKRTAADAIQLQTHIEDYAIHRFMFVSAALADQWPCLFCWLLHNASKKLKVSGATIENEIEKIKREQEAVTKAEWIDEKSELLWQTIKKLGLNLTDFFVLNVLLLNVDKSLLNRITSL